MTRRLRDVEGPHADARLVVGGAPAAAAEVAVVLLHGRGGTAEGIVRLADEFYRPGVTLLAPAARRSTWFPAGHDAPIADNEPALSSAVDCVAGAVAAAGDVGLPPTRTLLVGVSQGGCVLAEFLCRRPRRFGGAVVASAVLPGEDLETRKVAGVDGDRDSLTPLDETPVLLDSSGADPHVPADRVRETGRVLEGGGATVDVRIDPGSGHGLSDATIGRIRDRIDALTP
ncbi:alpha/beta hydrolase [Halorubrum cibi]|uniref:Phospholipase/carboxylesterase n=1 Tax=Halorubrum cibi TaxID=413815 RepID=A0A521CYK6_9EURY|nr:phospholipase [Halorubrum cibi]SMO63841.1 phospholipase/carboxylesterase [Halorubrum cibi]